MSTPAYIVKRRGLFTLAIVTFVLVAGLEGPGVFLCLFHCFILFLTHPGQLHFNIRNPRVLFHNGFRGQNTNGLGTVFNGFRFIDQNVTVEHDLKLRAVIIAQAPVAEILIDEP